MKQYTGSQLMALEWEQCIQGRLTCSRKRNLDFLRDTVEAKELQARLNALKTQPSNLDNRTESTDVSGGKDGEMPRATITAGDGTKHTITASSCNELAQKAYNLAFTFSQPAEKPGIGQTVEAYALRWIEMQKESCCKSGWAKVQEFHLKLILPLIGAYDIAKIKNSDIKSAFAKLRKPDGTQYSQKYCAAIMHTTNSMFSQAVADGIIPVNPCPKNRDVKNPGVSVHEPEEMRITVEDVQMIFSDVLPKIPEKDVMSRLYLAAALTIGCRRQEWAALQWESINLDGDEPGFWVKQKVVYNGPAGNKGELTQGAKTESGVRWEPIPEIVLPYFRAARPEDGMGFVFRGPRYNPDGKKHISENAFSDIVKKASGYLPENIRKQINHLTAHIGRRTSTDVSRQAGNGTPVIAAMMGHSPKDVHAVTEGIYMHVSKGEKHAAAHKVSEFLAGKTA